VIGHDELDDRPIHQEFRIASKTGGFFDYVGVCSTRTNTRTFRSTSSIRAISTSSMPALRSYGVSNDDAVRHRHGLLLRRRRDGLQPDEHQLRLIGHSDRQGSDLYRRLRNAVQGSGRIRRTHGTFDACLEPHRRGACSGRRSTQAQQTGLLFDGGGMFLAIRQPIANSSLSDSWNKALFKPTPRINSIGQLDLCHVLAGIPPRRGQRTAARRSPAWGM
jgi:hypothetical protein